MADLMGNFGFRGWLAAPFGLAAMALLVSACGGSSGESDGLLAVARSKADAPIEVSAGSPIVIGVSVALTGPQAQAGQEDLDAVAGGVALWKATNGENIQGHSIQLRAEDDGCTNAETAEAAANRLLRQPGLVGVIGPECSAGVEAAMPVYAKAGIVSISGSATATGLTSHVRNNPPYFFRTAYRNDLQGGLIGLFAALSLQPRLVYVIDDSESYGEDLANAAEQVMRERGVRVARRAVRQGTVDYTKLTKEIAEANPELVVFTGFNPDAALIYRQLRDAGYKGLYGAGDAAATESTFIEPVGANEAEGVLFSGCAVNMPSSVRAKLAAVHGEEAKSSAFPAQYIDAATVLLNAVKKVAKIANGSSLAIDPRELRTAVQEAQLVGVSGTFSFDRNGDRAPPGVDDVSGIAAQAAKALDMNVYPQLGLIPCQVQDGKLVNLLGPGAGTVRGAPSPQQ